MTAQMITQAFTVLAAAGLWIAGPGAGSEASFYQAELRGAVAASASGRAEFGAVPAAEDGSPVFTVSLGASGQESAILFTRRNGSSLDVGRYRITENADRDGEILALVMTGTPTEPIGVFRGQSGWLEVTRASDQTLVGRFQVDAVGFLAADPEREDREVTVSGCFAI